MVGSAAGGAPLAQCLGYSGCSVAVSRRLPGPAEGTAFCGALQGFRTSIITTESPGWGQRGHRKLIWLRRAPRCWPLLVKKKYIKKLEGACISGLALLKIITKQRKVQ